MSERMRCPKCYKDQWIGLTEMRERNVDVHTAVVMRDELEGDVYVECGVCGWTWADPEAVAEARRRVNAVKRAHNEVGRPEPREDVPEVEHQKQPQAAARGGRPRQKPI